MNNYAPEVNRDYEGLQVLPARQRAAVPIPLPDYKNEDQYFPSEPPNHRILGLTTRVFWIIVIVLVIVVAAGIGAGVGIGLSSQKTSKSR